MAKKKRRNGDNQPPQPSIGRKKYSFEKVTPRNEHQKDYLDAIDQNVITIGSGPAGSGKTYLAVYQALCHLRSKISDINRIIITRPAVEAGERLGFLPGDLDDKMDPFMRPIHDSLVDILGLGVAKQKIERGVIEIAPIAYMRGRTFNNCFIIVDEAQNATLEQLKMIVTRVGEGTKLVIDGDPSQADVKNSGLSVLEKILDGVEDTAITRFDSKDIVRSKIVLQVVDAFKKYESAV